MTAAAPPSDRRPAAWALALAFAPMAMCLTLAVLGDGAWAVDRYLRPRWRGAKEPTPAAH